MSPLGRLLLKIHFVHSTHSTKGRDIYWIYPDDKQLQRIWNLELAASLRELVPAATYTNELEKKCFAIAEHRSIDCATPVPVDPYGFVSFVRWQHLLKCWRYQLATPPVNGRATLVRVPPGKLTGLEPITFQVYTDRQGRGWITSVQAEDSLRNLLPAPYNR